MKASRKDLKRQFSIKQRLKRYSSQKAMRVFMATTLAASATVLPAFQLFTSNANVAQAAGLGSIDIFTNAEFDNTGATDGAGYAVANENGTYDLSFELDASAQVQGAVLSNQKAVFLVPSDWEVTTQNVSALVTSEITPFTLGDIPGVTPVVNTAVSAVLSAAAYDVGYIASGSDVATQ